jgi:hypothetical protein
MKPKVNKNLQKQMQKTNKFLVVTLLYALHNVNRTERIAQPFNLTYCRILVLDVPLIARIVELVALIRERR